MWVCAQSRLDAAAPAPSAIWGRLNCVVCTGKFLTLGDEHRTWPVRAFRNVHEKLLSKVVLVNCIWRDKLLVITARSKYCITVSIINQPRTLRGYEQNSICSACSTGLRYYSWLERNVICVTLFDSERNWWLIESLGSDWMHSIKWSMWLWAIFSLHCTRILTHKSVVTCIEWQKNGYR